MALFSSIFPSAEPPASNAGRISIAGRIQETLAFQQANLASRSIQWATNTDAADEKLLFK
jgi:hypothetical protein